jgi:hypothetical protein
VETSDLRDKSLLLVVPADKNLSVRKRVEALSEGSWTIPQQLLQDIQATDIVDNITTNIKVTLKEQIEKLKKLIEEKYADNPDIRELFLEYLPASYAAIQHWTKKEGWEEAVMERIRSSYIFSKERRTAVIDIIYQKAITKGDMKAAELFCKLSGDLDTGKNPKASKEIEDYRNYNSILHKKK